VVSLFSGVIMNDGKSGVSGYILKPVNYHEFIEVVLTIKLHWTLSELSE
jgi:hypothetical protein